MLDGAAQEMQLYNIEAEINVVGSILLEPTLIESCFVKPEQLYDNRNKNILFIMNELHSKELPIDPIQIMDRASKAKAVERIGGLDYVMQLLNAIPTTTNFIGYQKIVIEYYERRKQIELAHSLIQASMSDEPDKVREKFIKDLESLGELSEDDEDDGHISKVMQKVFEDIEKVYEGYPGAPVGFKDLDEITNGFQKEDLVIVAARPSCGKTALVVNMLENYAKGYLEGKGGPAVLFSIEMPEVAVGKRILSNSSCIDSDLIRNAHKRFDMNHWKKVSQAMAMVSQTPLHIFDKPSIDISYIKKKLKLIADKYLGEHILVAIDYLQLIKGEEHLRNNRSREVGEIANGLKRIARELGNITIIALSQLSRDVEKRQDKRPMSSDLRDSGEVEQISDVIIMLYRDDYYDRETENKGIMELIITKNRNGATGTVMLGFKKEQSKFYNLIRR